MSEKIYFIQDGELWQMSQIEEWGGRRGMNPGGMGRSITDYAPSCLACGGIKPDKNYGFIEEARGHQLGCPIKELLEADDESR